MRADFPYDPQAKLENGFCTKPRAPRGDGYHAAGHAAGQGPDMPGWARQPLSKARLRSCPYPRPKTIPAPSRSLADFRLTGTGLTERDTQLDTSLMEIPEAPKARTRPSTDPVETQLMYPAGITAVRTFSAARRRPPKRIKRKYRRTQIIKLTSVRQ